MTKRKSTKRALLLSALSLLMCVSMLIGSTFAWFTDSVTSGSNKIQAGNLQVDLELYDKATDKWNSVKENNGPIFTYTNWEPGYVDAKLLKVENEGSLALKWKAKITTQASLGILADVIDVFVKPGVTEAEFEALSRADLSGWTNAGTVRQFVAGIETSTYGNLNPKGTTGDSATLGIALKMREEAGNEYKNETLGVFDIMILATQLTAEEDSFNDQYDKEAPFPQGKPSTLSDTVDEITTVVEVPDEAPEGNYTLDIPAITYENKAGATTMSLDINLKRNGNPVNNDGVPYTVTINLPHPFMSMDNFKVYHGERLVENAQYNEESHTITFTTTGFSPFSIEYTDYTDPSFKLDYTTIDADADKYTIRKGIFVGKNPADYDETLNSKDSDFFIVEYTKGGKKYYAVSERKSTLVIARDDANALIDSKEDGYYDNVLKTNVNADLWQAFIQDSRSFKLGASTVFILPGTYECGTTLSVSISCDIIGLGDKDNIHIIKGDSEGSNQHLFNCTNTTDEYIQVVIRNMTLEAVKKNINKNQKRDNAAVQSIRRSKVKCYDLVIIKGAVGGSDNDAFYVNGNNLACDAYLYAENCVLKNATKTSYSAGDIVSTHQKAKYTQHFYYYNITCEGSQNTALNPKPTQAMGKTNIKNVQLPADNWTWEID